MFYRRFASFICIYVAAAIATAHNHTRSVTASDLEATAYPLTTENPETSKREPDQLVTESTTVDLGSLLDAGDGTVVTLVAGDTRLAAHKAVLTARSPVFAAKLQRMTLEASTGEVAISDVEGPVLRQMLAYMYTLQAPQLPSMASQLLVAADTYCLPALKAHCEQQVAAQLSVETAVTAAVLAVRHSCSTLRQAAVAFIKAHIFHVMATQGWTDAMNSQPEELMKVIRLLPDSPAEASVPATGGSTTDPTTQPHSDHSGHCGQTPSSAAPPTTAFSTSPSDDAVSRMRRLSAEEKNRMLIEAAKEGAVQEVMALLAAGADVGARNEQGYTALHWAAYGGHVEVVKALLAAGADVRSRGERGYTSLHWAAYGGHVEAVKALIAAGADLWPRGERGFTALHWAAQEGHVEAVKALLAAGANVGARDEQGYTALHWAAQEGHVEAVEALLAAGADTGSRGKGGYTALHRAAYAGHVEVVKALLAAGANVGVRDEQGYTALHWAVQEGHVEVVEALLAAGADAGSRGEGGFTALHRAAKEGHMEVARRLLAAGADVEARNRWGETPLHYAAAMGQAAVVPLLVEEASADPNARSESGGTPLHAAAETGQAEAAAALLQVGATRAATDNKGRTPLDIAREHNRQQLIDMLTT